MLTRARDGWAHRGMLEQSKASGRGGGADVGWGGQVGVSGHTCFLPFSRANGFSCFPATAVS